MGCPTACVSGVWASEENIREQEKLEARKMLAVGAADSHKSIARFVGQCLFSKDNLLPESSKLIRCAPRIYPLFG